MILLGIVAIVLAYLIGSINFAVIFSAIFMKKDVRELGSGNAGTTNVMRNGGFLPGALTFLCDSLKGFAASFIGLKIFEYLSHNASGEWTAPIYGALVCGLFCMIGHVFPIFFGFKGGKGIVCGATITMILDWRVFLVLAAVFFTCFFISRIVSLSSILVSASFTIGFVLRYWGNLPLQIGTAVIGIFAIWMHRENIKRLRNGTERKFSFGSKEKKQ
jgi:glycerol-3-phosphate acyltransferase PlsY